jgi:hypothetical protein
MARGGGVLELRSRTPRPQHGFLYNIFSNRPIACQPVREAHQLGTHGLEKLAECISQVLSALVRACLNHV